MFKKCLILSFLVCVLQEAKSAAAAVDLETMSARITEIDGEIKRAMREIEPIERIGEDIKVGKEGKLPSSAWQKYEDTLNTKEQQIFKYDPEIKSLRSQVKTLPPEIGGSLSRKITVLEKNRDSAIRLLYGLKQQIQKKVKQERDNEARDSYTEGLPARRAAAGGAGAGAGAAIDAEDGGARAASRSRSPSRRAARSGGGSGASAAPGASADMIAMLGGSAVPTPSTAPLARGSASTASAAYASPSMIAMLGGGAVPAPSAIAFAQVYIESSYGSSSDKPLPSSLKITFNPSKKDEFIRMLTDHLLVSHTPKYKDMFEESLRYEHDTREFKALQDRWLEESKHKSFATGHDSTERNIEFIIKAAQAIKDGMDEITLPIEVIIHKKRADFAGQRGVYALNTKGEVGEKIAGY